MAEIQYHDILWLELTRIPGIGKKRVQLLKQRYTTIEQIWKANEGDLLAMRFPKEAVQAILKGPDEKRAERQIRSWQERGIRICSLDHQLYPEYLKSIYDAPPVLYLAGQMELMKEPMMAVVGSRRCTSYGSRVSHYLGRVLVERGYTVVSGMAVGVDAWSHYGALDAHGGTVAVLGCGVDVCYPPEHRSLWNRIRSEGLLVSEYPPETEPRSGFFPQRNRIISGLSRGVIVVEAGEKSGSLITADQALEQGRDVYCVPGSIFSAISRGTNYLIQQGGAMLLMSPEDIPMVKRPYPEIRKNKEILHTKQEEWVYQALEKEGRTTYDLQRESGFSSQELQQVLASMEIRGIIRMTPDQHWIRLL